MGSTNQERITDLPSITNINDSDILYLVQGYISSSNVGLSVQTTVGQLLTLAQNQIIKSSIGDPNGNVAGTPYQLCWDTTGQILYICVTAGTATTAIWAPISGAVPGFPWTEVTGTTQIIDANNGYTANNNSQVVFTMPATSQVGDRVEIQGLGLGGWRINSGNYQLRVGSLVSTVTTGYIESTNRYDSIILVCAQANAIWTCVGGPQGNINII